MAAIINNYFKLRTKHQWLLINFHYCKPNDAAIATCISTVGQQLIPHGENFERFFMEMLRTTFFKTIFLNILCPICTYSTEMALTKAISDITVNGK